MQNHLFLAPIELRDWHPMVLNWTKKSGMSSRVYFLPSGKAIFLSIYFSSVGQPFCRRFNVSNRMKNKGF